MAEEQVTQEVAFVDPKPLYQSKTFWMNLIAALLPLFPVVGEWVNANVEIYASIWAGLATVLRLITKDKVNLLG